MVNLTNEEYATLVGQRVEAQANAIRFKIALQAISDEFGNTKPSKARMGEIADWGLNPKGPFPA